LLVERSVDAQLVFVVPSCYEHRGGIADENEMVAAAADQADLLVVLLDGEREEYIVKGAQGELAIGVLAPWSIEESSALSTEARDAQI